MDKSDAEERIALIRDVMERSARYTHFSGLSGVISGVVALIGCAVTHYWVFRVPSSERQVGLFALTWLVVLLTAVVVDLALADRDARASGSSLWTPATWHVAQAALPGILAGLILSCAWLLVGKVALIVTVPSAWALGYGTALYAAGAFCVKAVRTYGAIQLTTATVWLLFLTGSEHAFVLQMAVQFGIYQILFGLWLSFSQRRRSHVQAAD